MGKSASTCSAATVFCSSSLHRPERHHADVSVPHFQLYRARCTADSCLSWHNSCQCSDNHVEEHDCHKHDYSQHDLSISTKYLLYVKTCANLYIQSSPIAQPTCSAGKTFPGTTCTQECGTDRPGFDYNAINLLSLSTAEGFKACAKACSQDSKCLTAQYAENNK